MPQPISVRNSTVRSPACQCQKLSAGTRYGWKRMGNKGTRQMPGDPASFGNANRHGLAARLYCAKDWCDFGVTPVSRTVAKTGKIRENLSNAQPRGAPGETARKPLFL